MIEPQRIGSLLERFKKIFKDKETEKVFIREIVEECVGKKLPTTIINIKKATLVISASPVVRSEITLHKEEIIRLCEERIQLKILTIRYS